MDTFQAHQRKKSRQSHGSSHEEVGINDISQPELISSLSLAERDEEIAVLPDVVPSDGPDPSATDSMVAQLMNRLSIREREKVLYDLHGIREEIEETPELLRTALAQMEVEIGLLSEKDAYEIASQQDNSYVQDRDFRVKFLRADDFDGKQAALRFVRHFQAKLDLFGAEKLTKTIVQDDLNKMDMDVLYSGYSQNLPARDSSGRIVWIWFTTPDQNTNFELSLVRGKGY